MSEYAEIKRSHDEGWFTSHERAQVLIDIIEKQREINAELTSRIHEDRYELDKIDCHLEWARGEYVKLTEE